MVKTIIILFLLMLTSCGNDKWNTEYGISQQEIFISECERTSGGMTEYCQCALGKVMNEWSSPEDCEADPNFFDRTMEFGAECLEELY